MLNPEGFSRQINDSGHLAAAVHAAPNQAHVEVGMEKSAGPVGLKAGNHLLDHRRGVADDAVVAGFGEVFVAEVEGGNQGAGAIHHHRFLVGHREGLTGPGHLDTPFA